MLSFSYPLVVSLGIISILVCIVYIKIKISKPNIRVAPLQYPIGTAVKIIQPIACIVNGVPANAPLWERGRIVEHFADRLIGICLDISPSDIHWFSIRDFEQCIVPIKESETIALQTATLDKAEEWLTSGSINTAIFLHCPSDVLDTIKSITKDCKTAIFLTK